jgi:hypothetical protein
MTNSGQFFEGMYEQLQCAHHPAIINSIKDYYVDEERVPFQLQPRTEITELQDSFSFFIELVACCMSPACFSILHYANGQTMMKNNKKRTINHF